jgi:hypothetical protein
VACFVQASVDQFISYFQRRHWGFCQFLCRQCPDEILKKVKNFGDQSELARFPPPMADTTISDTTISTPTHAIFPMGA